MLYLEDYLELIEHLPQELRDRLTYIRESDLKVNNSSLHLEAKVAQSFASASKLSPEQRQSEYEEILKEYQKTMKYADDKVQIATQTHEIVIKLIQRLDTELEKFKLELEADHAGITEELERRSLELDNEKSYNFQDHIDRRSSDVVDHHDQQQKRFDQDALIQRRQRIRDFKAGRPKGHSARARQRILSATDAAHAVSPIATNSDKSHESQNYNRQNNGIVAPFSTLPLSSRHDPIMMAASQAINATQNMTPGRRTSSLKASYAAVNSGRLQPPTPAQQQQQATTRSLFDQNSLTPGKIYCKCAGAIHDPMMIACDNVSCKHEWFHYQCVGITTPPDGEWYCEDCRILVNT